MSGKSRSSRPAKIARQLPFCNKHSLVFGENLWRFPVCICKISQSFCDISDKKALSSGLNMEMANSDEKTVIILEHVDENGAVSHHRCEKLIFTNKIISMVPLPGKFMASSYLAASAAVKVTKIDNYYPKLNISAMIRCQNCETIFPTKYQFQRHQCEFYGKKFYVSAGIDADSASSDSVQSSSVAEVIKFECEICKKSFINKNYLERHLQVHEDVKKTTCEYCNKQFVSENRLRIHKENHCKKAGDITKFYRSDVTVWKCLKCHEVFSSMTMAMSHADSCYEVVVSDNEKKMKIVEKISTEILLQCEFCNRTYADKSLLLTHQKTHTTEKNYECVICEIIFESYSQATQHWLTKCPENFNLFFLPKLTYCELCDRTFKSHEMLYNHKIKKKHYSMKIHKETSANLNYRRDDLIESSKSQPDEKKIAEKETVDKIYKDVLEALEVPPTASTHLFFENKNLKDDKENIDSTLIKIEPTTDEEEAPENGKKKRGRKRKNSIKNRRSKKISTASEGYKYQCENCVKVWDTICELETHKDKEHKNNFNCNECGQVLQSNKALFIHQRIHKNLKPYVCDTCGRCYSQTSHLWQHMRFHQGIKPFACPHEGCEARYTIRPDLKDHIRKVHTRERPFKCAVCGKCFLTGSVYYQHRLIHTNDRRYGCDVCGKRFFRADALNNHKRIHTNERPYPCWVCRREFRQKGDRNKHLRTQHMESLV